MKGKFWLLFIALVCCFQSGVASPIDDIIKGLRNIDNYRADARLVVMMPAQPNDVVYQLKLTQERAADADRWSPCNYLIDWTLDTPSGPQGGFGAYFDGHHYRYRGSRLQEYHVEWDSVPFMPRGKVDEGVQCQVQFANTLPAFIANELESLSGVADVVVKASLDTMVSGERRALVTIEHFNDGMLARRGYYCFDRATFYPVKIENENNIGALSEQTVSVTYTPATDVEPIAWTESWLIDQYPEAFERFRENNFRVENLPGSRLPQFSLENIDGNRYNHAGDDTFPNPVILTFIDPATGYNSQLIAAIRQAVEGLPMDVDVMYAFLGSNVDQITETMGDIAPDEQVFTSAHTLSRHMGVTDCPVIILVGRDGRVADVVLGYNKDLATVVIQKMALVK